MQRQSSYARDANAPKLGSRWFWEIDKPHAREVIEVTEVIWNGEEWWVRTKSLLTDAAVIGRWSREKNEVLNDLSRFWEAVTPVGGPITPRFYETHSVEDGIEARWGT